jgi:hypothetical protein
MCLTKEKIKVMKKLIRFVLVLALGAFLGYVFHDTIDTKMKARLGDKRLRTSTPKPRSSQKKQMML